MHVSLTSCYRVSGKENVREEGDWLGDQHGIREGDVHGHRQGQAVSPRMTHSEQEGPAQNEETCRSL